MDMDRRVTEDREPQEDEYVDSGWRCHPTPDKRGWFKVHDKNSVHMDGCVPLYVKKSHADARLAQ
jgi:hypothetical protein